MSRTKKRSPEEQVRREKIRELLQSSGVSSMEDIQKLFKETIAEFMENGLDAELDEELGYSKYDYKNKDTDNSRNGHSSKTLRTSFGDVEVSVPRDRKGNFEPQILKKNQTSISQDIEEKILSMYAKGMTTSDIEAHIRDIYGIAVSDTTVSRVTDKILPIAKEWQQRPLEAVYAVVFLDATHYHVRSEGQIIKKAVYIAIGINLDGKKDVLGMWVGENESAKFWATVLNGLKNRGVEDIFIACTDNLTGFSSAIEAVFPKTEIQNCIIHQLRNSSKYVSYKDLKALMADLKAVYAAVDEPAALDALDAFSERWDKKYPKISQSWRDNWVNLSTYFKYPEEVRRLIYTTNTIEGFNRQLRKVTKSKSVFPTDDSLLKMLYYHQGEDCLTLNVWSNETGPSEGKTVMVFFHGGSFGWGGTCDPMYDGENLVQKYPDVVLLTVESRLGLLGYVDFTEVPGGEDYPTSGNLGLLDQVCALQWVQKNISAFGGDPDNVTIFGELKLSQYAGL